MTPRRLALSSVGPLAGKTTLARYIAGRYGFLHAKHPETLYIEYTQRQGMTIEELLAHKEGHRQGLQTLGTELGFDDPGRAGTWITKTLQRAHPYWEWAPVVFDNARGEPQAAYLRSLGFTIVQLIIVERERARRAGSVQYYTQVCHNMRARPDVEGGIAHPDIILPADRPVEELAYALLGPASDPLSC